jgi:hypothetical protein
MLKKVVGLLVVAFSFGAFADTIHCEGTYQPQGGDLQKIELDKGSDNRTLALAIYPAESENPGYLTMHYAITRIIPMFPVYSVEAKQDLRRVDGSLTELSLAIHTEGVSVSGTPGMPARLTEKVTSPRGGQPVTRQYALTCQIQH